MRHKTFKLAELKADGSGSFTALASVFGNVDVQGDRMMKGSFRKTLDAWRESGHPIPVILSHQWDDPMAMVGKADPRAVMETDDGLLVQGQIDTSTPVGKQVHKLMKERLLNGWSFGYTVPEDGEKQAEDGANEVYEVDLIEVGPTLRGANPEAQLQEIKSALAEVTEEQEAPPAEEPDEELEEESDEDASDQPAVEDEPAEEPETAKASPQDALKHDSLAIALEILSDGASLIEYKQEEPEPEPEPPSEDEQLRRFVGLTI